MKNVFPYEGSGDEDGIPKEIYSRTEKSSMICIWSHCKERDYRKVQTPKNSL